MVKFCVVAAEKEERRSLVNTNSEKAFITVTKQN